MGHKEVLGIVVLSFCCNGVAYQERIAKYDTIITTTNDIDRPEPSAIHHCQDHDKASDKEVAQMAITTLASMATSILNIGTDSHNPKVVGTNVINILSSFVNLVTFAMRNPQLVELLNDDLFQDTLRTYIVRSLIDKQPDMLDETM